MRRKAILVGLATTLFLAAPAASTPMAAAGFRNCTELHKKYPHGVGRVGARDHTSGKPVTTFTRSNRLYRQNQGLDRDKDGIACEKR